MDREEFINLLRKLDQKFTNYGLCFQYLIDKYNESYFNGYQSCINDLSSEIKIMIAELNHLNIDPDF